MNTLLHKIPAVHATSVLPQNGILKVGFDGREKGVSCPRRTLHFSLGELVRPHPGVIDQENWDAKKYAVIAPLIELEPQLININAYDTFTIGEFSLTGKAAILLVPEGTVVSEHNFRMATYDPNKETLREAIDRIITGEQLWTIRMAENYAGKFDNSDVALAEAMIGQVNINTPQFFRYFLEKHKFISFGLHVKSVVGEGYQIGRLESAISIALIAAYSVDSGGLNFLQSYISLLAKKLADSFKDAPPFS